MIALPLSSGSGPALLALRRHESALARSLERLASGRRINRGSDDPAGLISATRLDAAIAALEAESRTIERSRANVNIADAKLAGLSSLMNDLNGLLVASSNSGALSDAEIEANQMQVDQIVASIQRFGGDAIKSLDGFRLPDDGNQALSDALGGALAAVASLATGGANDLRSGNFEAAQTALSEAASAFASARGTVGAFDRYTLEPRFNAIAVTRERLLAARSSILDTDFAQETSELSRLRTLLEASARLLKISDENDRRVLDLLA